MKLKKLLNIRHWDDFLKHSSLMFAAMAIVNVLSLLYQLVMARNLTAVDYGILNSLLSFYIIVAIPVGGIQGVITKFVSNFEALNQLETIEIFILALVKKIFYLGCAALLFFALAAKLIASFLHIDSVFYVMLVGLIISISCLLPLGLGSLNGLQQFRQLGISMVLNAAVKFFLGVVLVMAGFKISGALTAIVIGGVCALFLSLSFLNKFLKKAGLKVNWSYLNRKISVSRINFPEIYRYFFPVAGSMLCFMLLTNSDVVLVKHFFPPLKAGYYSLAQMAGKIILFLPGAISVVMFPKTSSSYAKKEDSRIILKKSLSAAGLLCGSAAVVFMLFPQVLAFILKLSPEIYAECAPLIRLFSFAMTFFALVHLFIFYYLSVHDLNYFIPLAGFTLTQIIIISLWHPSLKAVLGVMCCSSAGLFFINVRMLRKNPAVAAG